MDFAGGTALTYQGGNTTQHRAYTGDAAAVPYGAAPEFTNINGAGLTGTLPAVGDDFTLAGYVRVDAGAAGNRDVLRVEVGGATVARLRHIGGPGNLRLDLDGQQLTTPLTTDVWHHVAVVRTRTKVEMWVDGSRVQQETTTGAAAPLDMGALSMALADGTNAADLALDEWGIWTREIDVADLAARRTHDRHFGGYAYGITDATEIGPLDTYIYQIRLVGYGLRLDTEFVRQTYASPTGSSVREIAANVLSIAGLSATFNSDGVELNDIVDRIIFAVVSVTDILRKLADTHKAIVTVDEWRTVNMVRRANVEHSDLHLIVGRGGNLRSIGKHSEPRFYANRAVVVGRGDEGIQEDPFVSDGVTREFDLSHEPRALLSVDVEGEPQEFGLSSDPWSIDTSLALVSLATTHPVPKSGDRIKIGYSTTPEIVYTADDQAAINEVGFPVSRLWLEDDIDTTSVARQRALAYLDRHNQRFQEYQFTTLQGLVRRLRQGVAPTFTAPRQGLHATRLLVERVLTHLRKGGPSFHAIEHTAAATALDFQGDSGDYWRELRAARPPAPRKLLTKAQDPGQIVLRGGNVATPARLPIDLGGSPAILMSNPDWLVPDGANLVRVSGHLLDEPVALTFIGRCRPDGALGAGQVMELQLWNATTSAAIGSSLVVDTSAPAGQRYVLRDITFPLRDFDLTYRTRILGGLRGATAWSFRIDGEVAYA